MVFIWNAKISDRNNLMPYDPEVNDAKNGEPKKGVFGVIIHSFFVVPFLLAVLSILLFAAVRILTMEKRSVYDYISDIKKGGIDKRWQAAFELSRILSNAKEVPQDQKFIDEMKSAYDASAHDDVRVRQYLILAMGRSSRGEFNEILLKDLPQEKDENLYAIITALGILKNNESTDALLKYLENDNPRIRLATVIALGQIGNVTTVNAVTEMLKDSEPNVVWDAAIALAKMNERTGKDVILNLMNRDYLNNFPNLSSVNQAKTMMVAINVTSTWNDPDINRQLQNLFNQDPNMNVRALARQVLDSQKS